LCLQWNEEIKYFSESDEEINYVWELLHCEEDESQTPFQSNMMNE
jgi:hypothetical protein